MDTEDYVRRLKAAADSYYSFHKNIPPLFRSMRKAAKQAVDEGVPVDTVADICRVTPGEVKTWVKRPT